MIIETLSAVPAAGKTAAFLQHIFETGERAIVASISRQLSKQSYDYFTNLGGEAVVVDTDNRRGKKSVNDAIEVAIQQADVVFITHAALLRMSDCSFLKGFSLYIDEVPELVSFERFAFTHSVNALLEVCDLKDGMITLKEDKREQVEQMALDGYKGKDDVCHAMFPLYKALLTGVPAKLVQAEDQNYCYFINDASSSEWEIFDKVTICSANFEQTLTGKILKHFNKWEFVESPLVDRLLFREYRNSSRITINVMTDSDWSKYHANKEQDGMTVYNRICNVLEGLLDDFIYTRNTYRAKLTKGTEVAYNPHGLNLYSDHTNVAVMFSYNPSPWQIPLMKELAQAAGLPENELMDAYIVSKYLEPAFQLCARCDIRNMYSNKPINLFVPDMKLAQYMKEKYFHHATISTAYKLQEPPKKKQTRKRNSFQSLYNMTPKERYRYMYLLRKLGRVLDVNNADDQLLVQEWIIKQRGNVVESNSSDDSD